MKKMFFIIGFLLACLVSLSQTFPTISTGKVNTIATSSPFTLEENDTLVWYQNINSSYELNLLICHDIETVNTSNFDGTFYYYAGIATNDTTASIEKYVLLDSEVYSFTQSANVNAIQHCMLFDSISYPYSKTMLIMSGDAQTFTVTPKLKTTKKGQ